jgi:hypothetical protein
MRCSRTSWRFQTKTSSSSSSAPCDRGSAELVEHNRQLAATRDLLLPRLVTGRLDISDVDLGVLTPTEAE